MWSHAGVGEISHRSCVPFLIDDDVAMTGAWITLLIGALAVYQWPASFDLTAGYGLGLVAGWSLWRAIPIGRIW
jgi:hypothetical protein